MTTTGWLAVYSISILAASLVGGFVPFVGKVTHSRLQLYLSLSAGVMLGACFFHIMPDAMAMSGAGFGWWMALGAVGRRVNAIVQRLRTTGKANGWPYLGLRDGDEYGIRGLCGWAEWLDVTEEGWERMLRGYGASATVGFGDGNPERSLP